MGKKKKVIQSEEYKNQDNKKIMLDKYFFRSLLNVLPLVVLLIVAIYIFIFFYFPHRDSLIFLYDLFLAGELWSGDLIFFSAFIVAMILGYQIIKTEELDKKTKLPLYIYGSLTVVYYTASPSILYNELLNNQLKWSIFLLADLVWEGIAIYFILKNIDKIRQKVHKT